MEEVGCKEGFEVKGKHLAQGCRDAGPSIGRWVEIDEGAKRNERKWKWDEG